MKTELKTQGTVVLDRVEVTEAIRSYLKDKHQFDLTKAMYQTKGNTLDAVTIDVVKNEGPGGRELAVVSPASSKSVSVTKRLKKHARVNMGIFDRLRDLFKSEKAGGSKQLAFDSVYRQVKEWYPTISEKKLQVYLYDRRQLPGMGFSKVTGIIDL